jgi:hypothetical protein
VQIPLWHDLRVDENNSAAACFNNPGASEWSPKKRVKRTSSLRAFW